MDSPTVSVPLRIDEDGSMRVSDTRVTLDTIIACHQQGDSPEDIHRGFPTVPLADIYALIAYYLANRATLDAYLKQRDQEAGRVQQMLESEYPPGITRAELLARLDSVDCAQSGE